MSDTERPASAPKMKTKAAVLAWAAERGIEIEVEHDVWTRAVSVIFAYTPEGSIFTAHDLHNLCIWHGRPNGPPNWREIGLELESAKLGPCDQGPECDYCHPESTP